MHRRWQLRSFGRKSTLSFRSVVNIHFLRPYGLVSVLGISFIADVMAQSGRWRWGRSRRRWHCVRCCTRGAGRGRGGRNCQRGEQRVIFGCATRHWRPWIQPRREERLERGGCGCRGCRWIVSRNNGKQRMPGEERKCIIILLDIPHFLTCIERFFQSAVRFWTWCFGTFPRLIGWYCSYLLPRQTLATNGR